MSSPDIGKQNMRHLKYALSVWLSGFLAGIMISIGGAVFLKVSADGSTFGRVLGAVLFSVGLYTILAFGLHLYTGKIGYLFVPGAKLGFKLSELLVTLLGNFCGTFLFGTILKEYFTSTTNVTALVNAKVEIPFWRIFLLAVGCGILMFVAVYGYKAAEHPGMKLVLVVLGVAGFILAGFEHSIADMFYVAAAGIWTKDTILRLLMIILGNTVGGAGMGGLVMLSRWLLPKKEET